MLQRRSDLFRRKMIGTVLPMVLFCEVVRSNDLPSLDELSLFMSQAERLQIDSKFPEPGIAEEPAPTLVLDKPATKPPAMTKIVLNGAVIRPDKSTVLFLNNGNKMLKPQKNTSESDLHFEFKAYGQLVELSPGESLNVRTSSDE